MTDPTAGTPEELPPADWYPDPELAGGQRYWDGSQWTEQRRAPGSSSAPAPGSSSAPEGTLPTFSDWFTASVKVAARNLFPAVLIYLATLIPASIITYSVGRWAFEDLEYVSGVTTSELVGFDGGRILIFVVVALLAGFAWLVATMVVIRLMQLAHEGRSEALGDSFSRAIARAPRYIGVIIALALAAMVASIIFVLLIALAGPAALLLLLLLIPAVFWLWVKLAFIQVVAVAAPVDRPLIQASWGLSKSRFWPIFGRLLVLTIAIAIASQILQSTADAFMEPAVDVNLTQEDFDEGFQVRDLFPSTGVLVAAAIVTAVIQSFASVFNSSGLVRLYKDAGGPTD